MHKTDYVILAIEYFIAVIYSATSSVHTVTNPYFSDYISEAIGFMIGAFLIASIVTIPIQMSKGWNKQEYVKKTIRGILVVIVIAFFSRLG